MPLVKELQEETGLYDYGARFYDPVVARWTSIDPLAEISRRWTPYNYVENDPVRLTDPDGMYETEAQIQETEQRRAQESADREAAKNSNTSYTNRFEVGMQQTPPKKQTLTIDKKGLEPYASTTTSISKKTTFADNILTQFAPVDTTTNSISETKTTVTVGTLTNFESGKDYMTSSTTNTVTTVSLGVTKDGQIFGITSINQTTSITTTTTPIISQNNTSATLDLSGTKTINWGTTTTSLPVTSKLSSDLRESVKDTIFENKSALQHNLRTILYPHDETN